MVDRIGISLPKEKRPLDLKDFSYSSKVIPTLILPEVYVRITFAFGQRDPNEFSGHIYRIIGEEKRWEAESFLDAAQEAWMRYGKSEEKYRSYVKEKLNEKWRELDGEKLTKRKLEFN